MRTARTINAALFGVIAIFIAAVPSVAGEKAPFSIDDYFLTTSLQVQDMTADGRWLACLVSNLGDRLPQDNVRFGDPTYIGPSRADLVVIETATGRSWRPLVSKAQVRALTWSKDGRRLAFFILRGGRFEIAVWTRETGKLNNVPAPKGKAVASNSPLIWSPDGRRLTFWVRTPQWEAKTAAMFKTAVDGPVIVMDTDQPFLQWEEIRRRDRLAIPVALDLEAGKMTELLPETPLLSFRLTKDGAAIVFERDVTEKTSYDVIGGTKNQLELLSLARGVPASGSAAPAGAPRVLLKPYERRQLTWSRDGRIVAYADKGDIFVMSIDDKEPRQLTGEKEDPAAKKDEVKAEPKDEKAKPKKQSFDVVRFSPDASLLLATSTRAQPDEDKDKPAPPGRRPTPPRQFWLIDVKSGTKQMVHELPEDEDARPSLQVVDWSPDGRAVYMTYSAPDKYDRGLVKFDLATKAFSDLRRSDRLASRWRMSEDGTTFVFAESDGDVPDELFSADASFATVRRLTDLNPRFKDKTLSQTELIAYRDADGKKLYGVLYYPANYERGKSYPLVTEVYERYFENGFNPALNLLASAGYAVLHPSVDFTTGYPGEAWAKGALAAVNEVVEMGVADPDRLGIQGTSYGGYATVLLITQTDRFKAAINNSGKVNMVSFYTQSPRLGVRNTHAPEKSQDRIGGTLWEFPERYLAHSAILQADRIKTPLLCITGDLDPNVEALQSQEIYYALRRLGKKCVWLRYRDGAHGGPNTVEERAHMYRRMVEWYDTYLKEKK